MKKIKMIPGIVLFLGVASCLCAFIGAMAWVAINGPFPGPPDVFLRMLAAGVALIGLGGIAMALLEYASW